MAKTRGTGLLMVWTDIDEEHEAEFNRWYDEEHLARLRAVPGVLSAGRYVALKGGPKYLAIYELEDHNVLRSAAYLDAVKYQPSPERSRIGTSRVGRNFLRNAYRQIFPVHTDPIERHNLIHVPGYQEQIDTMRQQLFTELEASGGLLIPVRPPAGDRLDQRKLRR